MDNGRFGGSELPGLVIAGDGDAGDDRGDALHGELLMLGTNGNAELIPQLGETSREFGGFLAGNSSTLSRERLLEAWVLGLTLSAAAACGGLVVGRLPHPSGAARSPSSRRLPWRPITAASSISPSIEASIASLVCVFAAVVLGPLAGAVVAIAGLLRDLPRTGHGPADSSVGDVDVEARSRDGGSRPHGRGDPGTSEVDAFLRHLRCGGRGVSRRDHRWRVACLRRAAIRGTSPAAQPFAMLSSSDLVSLPAARTDGVRAGVRLLDDFAVERRAVRAPSTCGSAAASALPAAARGE